MELTKDSIRKKKLFIATFGCQMNEYDSQRMAQLLHNRYLLTERPEDADLILINTCSIREKAENKVYSLAGRYRKLKQKNPNLIIGIGGCVAQQEGERLLKRAPHVDFVFGPQGLYDLPELIKKAEESRTRSLAIDLIRDFQIPYIDAPLPEKNPVRAFVTIMQGCDNFCTYCIVPYVRGREISRPPEEIIAEIRAVVAEGAKDVTLLGQNVNSYGNKNKEYPSFAELLHMASKVEGLKRLRYTTSHPKDLSTEVMHCFAELEPLCEHLHLPVQSGSSRVLKLMNRRYTRDDYLRKVDELKKICPEITLTTDIIVGFPGETDEDFKHTLSLLKEVEFDQIFAFKYSSRPYTKASQMEDDVDEETKSERLTRVLELQNEIGLNRYRLLEGNKVEVLVEGKSKANENELTGHTRGNHVVNFPGPAHLIGKFVMVTIERACHHSLRGIPDIEQSALESGQSCLNAKAA